MKQQQQQQQNVVTRVQLASRTTKLQNTAVAHTTPNSKPPEATVVSYKGFSDTNGPLENNLLPTPQLEEEYKNSIILVQANRLSSPGADELDELPPRNVLASSFRRDKVLQPLPVYIHRRGNKTYTFLKGLQCVMWRWGLVM